MRAELNEIGWWMGDRLYSALFHCKLDRRITSEPLWTLSSSSFHFTYSAVITRKVWNRKRRLYCNTEVYLMLSKKYSIDRHLNWSVFTAQLLCPMLIGLFKVVTWVKKSSSYFRVFWLSLCEKNCKFKKLNSSL